MRLNQILALASVTQRIRGPVSVALFFSTGWATAQNIIYPSGSGVINMVTDTRYLLRPNDNSAAAATYNSDKIQRAIIAASGNQSGKVSQVLYFPNGTYYINKKLTLGTTYQPGTDSRELTVQGQSREGTVIRLIDASPGFNGATTAVTPMLVFFEPATSGTVSFSGTESAPRVDDKATFNNNAMGNYVKNITFDVGANNPNAVGIDFISNNYGGISDVTIKTRDTQLRGKIGLKMTVNLGGIGYIKNVRVEGFDYGIKVAIYITDYIFEDIDLEGQRIAGLVNLDKPIQVRRLLSRNAVPAIINTETIDPGKPGVGSVVVLDSRLTYTGDRSLPVPAINNQEGSLFARNLIIDYPVRLLDRGVDRSAELSDGGEFSAKGIFGINGPTTGRSMNLPIKDAPIVSWDENVTNWIIVDPNANGEADDADAINAAIASGKSTVCVRYGTITINKTIKFPEGHAVKRFLVLGQFRMTGASLTTTDGVFDASVKQPVIEVGTGSNDALVIEGIKTTNGKYFQYVQNNSTKTLILRHNAFYGANRVYRNKYSTTHKPGTLFIEDMASLAENPYGVTQPGPAYLFDHQEVFARSFNPENANPHMLNRGGKVVILGFKTEGEGVPFATSQGGFTEVLGGEVNGVFRGAPVNGVYPKLHQEIINNDRSSVSIIATERAGFTDTVRDTIVVETQSTATKYLFKGVMPQTSKANKFVLSTDIPLYISHVPANTPPPAPARVRIFEIFGGGGTAGNGFRNDYVMLANYGSAAVSLNGYSLQYASAGTSGTWAKTNLSGTIQPGHLYLIQQFTGGVGSKNLPTPDATGTINIGSSAGKVALFSNQTAFTGDDPQLVSGSGWVDLVGYGSSGDVFRGSDQGPAGSNATAIGRSYTTQPVDGNSIDFSARAPSPRNTSSLINEGNPAGSRLATVSPESVAELPLSVVLLPNPLTDGQLRAVIQGAGGQPLLVELTDAQGKVVRWQRWPAAEVEQPVVWDISQQAVGLYLLRVQTPQGQQTRKLIKSD